MAGQAMARTPVAGTAVARSPYTCRRASLHAAGRARQAASRSSRTRTTAANTKLAMRPGDAVHATPRSARPLPP